MNPETGIPAGSVGAFIEASLNFVIVAFVMFLVVKAYNRMKASLDGPEEPAAEEPELSDEVELLIRDPGRSVPLRPPPPATTHRIARPCRAIDQPCRSRVTPRGSVET